MFVYRVTPSAGPGEKPETKSGFGMDTVLGWLGMGRAAKNGPGGGAEITGGPAESGEAELDKTQAALEELRKGVDANQALQGLIDRVRAAFYHDLAERGDIGPGEFPVYWGRVEQKINAYIDAARQRQIESLPEFRDLNAFIGNVENLSKLKDQAGFSPQWIAGTLNGIPFVGDILHGLFMSWADESKKENNDKDTFVGGLLRRWGNALKPGEVVATLMVEEAARRGQAGAESAPGTVAENAGSTAESAEKSDARLTPDVKKFLKKFRLAENDAKTKEDLEALWEKPYIAQSQEDLEALLKQADGSVARGGFVRKLDQLARRHLGLVDKLEIRLLDARLAGAPWQKDVLDALDEAFKKPAKPTATKVRDFLTAINEEDPDSLTAAKDKLA